MQFEVGDKVMWRDDKNDPGVVEKVSENVIWVKWKTAGLINYSSQFWYLITVVEKNNNEFKTIQVVKLEDFTGTLVEYKGRKYKLSLVE